MRTLSALTVAATGARFVPLLGLGLLLVAIGGCGGEGRTGGSGAAAPPTPTPTATATATATAVPAVVPAPATLPGSSDSEARFEARIGVPFGDADVVVALAADGIAPTRLDRSVSCDALPGTVGDVYRALVGGEPLLFEIWVYPTPRVLAGSPWIIAEGGRASGCGSYGGAGSPAYVVGNVVFTTSSPPGAAREQLIGGLLSLRAVAGTSTPLPEASFPFAASDLLAALASAGLAYTPDSDALACREAGAVGFGYGSPDAPTFLLWVYSSAGELSDDWIVEDGKRPRYHLDDPAACAESGWIYWHENLVLALEAPGWATADTDRATLVDAFLSLVNPAVAP